MRILILPWRYDDFAENTIEAALVRGACPLHDTGSLRLHLG
jgi:hypothetical protein